MKILLKIAYDGQNYVGFQKQKNGMTIQSKIEIALSLLYKKNISIIGASRTDSGVHALGQRAMFSILDNNIPIDHVPYAINSMLPNDIVITKAEFVNENFHPRYDAKRKLYQYKIYNDSFLNPILRNYCHFEKKQLDFNKMVSASKFFIGTHDFISFSSVGGNVKTTVRTIFDLSISKKNETIEINITGNGFLYNMVRIISGTLIYVGQNKIKPEDIPAIILKKDRTLAGKTAPAKALTLIDIIY